MCSKIKGHVCVSMIIFRKEMHSMRIYPCHWFTVFSDFKEVGVGVCMGGNMATFNVCTDCKDPYFKTRPSVEIVH